MWGDARKRGAALKLLARGEPRALFAFDLREESLEHILLHHELVPEILPVGARHFESKLLQMRNEHVPQNGRILFIDD